MTAVSLVGFAIALALWPGPRWVLYRVIDLPPRPPRTPRWLGRRGTRTDPFAVAAAFDLFAVCLQAGLPVAAAARAVAESAPAPLADRLSATADLLELGADPERAWAAEADTAGSRKGDTATGFESLATLARRSARAGSALSRGVAELAEDTRRQAHDDALARAERAGVMVSGPLGLCFLPAFVCLGIVPVVIGLAATTLSGI